MRNWTKWLINHNLRFTLYILAIFIALPIYILRHCGLGLIEAFEDLTYDLRAIKKQPKE